MHFTDPRSSLERLVMAGKAAIVFLLLTSGALLAPIPVSGADDGAGTTIEDFTLYSYGESEGDLSWQLTGAKAVRESDGLAVKKFELAVQEERNGKKDVVAKLAGKQLRLEGSRGEYLARMPGEISIEMGNGLEGIAHGVQHDFAQDRTSGEELDVTRSREGGKLSLAGSSFTYLYGSDELRIDSGFEVISINPSEEKTEISGAKLNWFPEGRIKMAGGISATLSSGWELKAEKMNWNPDEGLLESSGSAEATKDGTHIEGQAMDYDNHEEKIIVFEGRLELKEE